MLLIIVLITLYIAMLAVLFFGTVLLFLNIPLYMYISITLFTLLALITISILIYKVHCMQLRRKYAIKR